MHISNLWNKLNIFREKIAFCALLLLVISAAMPVCAQQQVKTVKVKGKNLPNYDERFLHYGFYLALNHSTYRVQRSPFFNRQIMDTVPNYSDSILYSVRGVGSPGFTLGFIVSARLAEHFDLRFAPGYSFYQRSVEFETKNGNPIQQLHEATYSFIEFPLLLKFKSLRRGNTRMYMIGGIKPGIEVGAKRNELTENQLRARASDLSIEYGVGFDLYYPLFKFAPEIRFSHGLANMAEPDFNIYSRSIRKLTSHTVTIYLNFE
jgi:hypothetical protein